MPSHSVFIDAAWTSAHKSLIGPQMKLAWHMPHQFEESDSSRYATDVLDNGVWRDWETAVLLAASCSKRLSFSAIARAMK